MDLVLAETPYGSILATTRRRQQIIPPAGTLAESIADGKDSENQISAGRAETQHAVVDNIVYYRSQRRKASAAGAAAVDGRRVHDHELWSNAFRRRFSPSRRLVRDLPERLLRRGMQLSNAGADDTNNSEGQDRLRRVRLHLNAGLGRSSEFIGAKKVL
jgi:hypothetical protein